jgi:hypothetical protein
VDAHWGQNLKEILPRFMVTPFTHYRHSLVALTTGAGLILLGACNSQPKAMTSAPSTAVASPTVAAIRPPAIPPAELAVKQFHEVVEPILRDKCYDCHGDGESRAGVAFDTLDQSPIGIHDGLLKNPELWLKVLNNTRANIMPPAGHPRPTPAEQATLEQWIKFAAFNEDPENPDPGRVTVHRLNRAEYRNTIHDLMGVDFNSELQFPNDDSGYGFDNIADVLNISPMLTEKYLNAAQAIVDEAVPTVSRVMPTTVVTGKDFLDQDGVRTGAGLKSGNGMVGMSYFQEWKVSHAFHITTAGEYRVVIEQAIRGSFNFVPGRCTVTLLVDGKPIAKNDYAWKGSNSNDELTPSFFNDYNARWQPGDHVVAITLHPLDPAPTTKGADILYFLRSVKLEGPTDPKQWVHPANYEKFFPRPDAPANAAARRDYARELIGAFASKAYRRPVRADTLEQLVGLAEKVYAEPGNTFEMGVSRAMVAVLASPRFLFRIEATEPAAPGQVYARLDEFSLAARLSYFLWSTLPDDELLKLAGNRQLRQNLVPQVQRMLADPRAAAFVKNFSGQWLQARAVENVAINEPVVLQSEGVTSKQQVTADQRKALEQEPAACFDYVARNNRSVLEFLDSDYVFLNQTLAGYYGIAPDVKGPEMRKVMLPAGDPRGGVLTMGSTLMVTSNPTRTSPVKRGKWVLENILGAPPPPPPPNVPDLDETAKKLADHTPTQREILAAHRANPVCASCHDRMDPLGLAMENFNALGWWREKVKGLPVDSSGQLFTGEKFKDVAQLKHVLVAEHRREFYRCLTEKLLTYAVGRGVEYYDVPTVDAIVARLDTNGGRFMSLLLGVIESAPFQEQRLSSPQSPPSQIAQAAPALAQNTPSP